MGDFPAWLVIAALLAIVGGPTSAAWIGVRIGMNGMKQDIQELKADNKTGSSQRGKMSERLAVIETKLGNVPGLWNGKERRS